MGIISVWDGVTHDANSTCYFANCFYLFQEMRFFFLLIYIEKGKIKSLLKLNFIPYRVNMRDHILLFCILQFLLLMSHQLLSHLQTLPVYWKQWNLSMELEYDKGYFGLFEEKGRMEWNGKWNWIPFTHETWDLKEYNKIEFHPWKGMESGILVLWITLHSGLLSM